MADANGLAEAMLRLEGFRPPGAACVVQAALALRRAFVPDAHLDRDLERVLGRRSAH